MAKGRNAVRAPGLDRAMASVGATVEKANGAGWCTVECPACAANGRPSLRVNVRTGEYKCFRCYASSEGDDGVPLPQFIEAPATPSLKTAATVGGGLPTLTDDLVARYHRVLMDSPAVLADLQRRRGWNDETVRQIGLGWDGSHLWIPIRNQAGALVNARMYDPFKRSLIKSFHYANDTGLQRTAAWAPFGVAALETSDEIWMFEGEPDGILAAQMGFPVLLITGGSGTWSPEVLPIIGQRRVVLCYDRDAAGIRGGRSIKQRLEAFDRKVILLEFKLSEPENKDFTDAIMRENRDAAWFRRIAEETWAGNAIPDEELTRPALPVRLGGGVPHEPVTVKAHVLGAMMVPLLVPQVIESKCRMNWDEKRCPVCPASKANGTLRKEIEPESQAFMLLADAPIRMHRMDFFRVLNLPVRCTMVKFDTPSMWQAQRLTLIPPMSERGGGDSTVRNAMHVSPADGRPLGVRANQLYMFKGRVEPDVSTNEWLFLAGDARPAEDDVDSFVMDRQLTAMTKEAFNPTEWTVEGIDRSMAIEEASLARHVTKVYGRSLLLRIVDLTYHSVLKFPFKDRAVSRGWMSVGIIGDTRTGKSETLGTFSTYIGLGKYMMEAANTTYAGLVGGLQQVGKSDKTWLVTWGLIPTNDRGMVIIDELSSMSTDDIGKMSGMRSSGVAELTKIRNSSTPARTRLIMSGNPRGSGRMLSSYSTPLEAFSELIGAPEDVARFDVALALRQGLDKDEANRDLGDRAQPVVIDLRRALVKFAWSRGVDQITWEEGAEDLCSTLGTAMAKDYDRSVPLVEPSEQDLRIARIAVAAAVRTFSIDESEPDSGKVLVRKCHVEFAVKTMRQAFDGDLAYNEYSRFLGRQRLKPASAKEVVLGISQDVSGTCRALMSVPRVTPSTISMVLALAQDDARVLLARLSQAGAAAFDRSGNGQSMRWTPEFMGLLRDMEQNPPKDGDRGVAF